MERAPRRVPGFVSRVLITPEIQDRDKYEHEIGIFLQEIGFQEGVIAHFQGWKPFYQDGTEVRLGDGFRSEVVIYVPDLGCSVSCGVFRLSCRKPAMNGRLRSAVRANQKGKRRMSGITEVIEPGGALEDAGRDAGKPMLPPERAQAILAADEFVYYVVRNFLRMAGGIGGTLSSGRLGRWIHKFPELGQYNRRSIGAQVTKRLWEKVEGQDHELLFCRIGETGDLVLSKYGQEIANRLPAVPGSSLMPPVLEIGELIPRVAEGPVVEFRHDTLVEDYERYSAVLDWYESRIEVARRYLMKLETEAEGCRKVRQGLKDMLDARSGSQSE